MNVGKMMKQIQKAQAKLQEDLASLDVEASAGGGVVTARMNGNKELLSIRLTPEAVTPDDLEMMQDLIVAAVNEAARKVDAEVQRLTQGITAGLPIPGMS